MWLGKFRSWVYGVGFGWQIGVGFATYIMTAAVYLTVALAALTGRPAVAFAICVGFGLLRGLAILLGATITSPERLIAFHRRFDALAEPVRRSVIGVQFAVAAVAACVAWAPGLAFMAHGGDPRRDGSPGGRGARAGPGTELNAAAGATRTLSGRDPQLVGLLPATA